MRRQLPVALLLLLSFATHADTVRQVAAGEVRSNPKDSRATWIRAFEAAAERYTTFEPDPGETVQWLEKAAVEAADLGFGKTADYLAVGAKVLCGEAGIPEAEEAWRRSLDERLVIILQFDRQRHSYTLAGVTIYSGSKGEAMDATVGSFERHLPGFRPEWIDTSPERPIARIATLEFRAGRNARVASTGTYLPFDRSAAPDVGRTWIVYENMIRANWWGEEVRPVALRILPALASRATPELLTNWYGYRLPLTDAGPQLEPREVERRLGSLRDPLRIMKGDLMPLVAGMTNEVTLTAVSFCTLREVLQGDAPPAHKAATLAELNWLIAHEALCFDPSSVTWQIDTFRFAAAVRELAGEVTDMEENGNANRAEDFFARYAVTTPAIDATLGVIGALPRVKVETVFVR